MIFLTEYDEKKHLRHTFEEGKEEAARINCLNRSEKSVLKAGALKRSRKNWRRTSRRSAVCWSGIRTDRSGSESEYNTNSTEKYPFYIPKSKTIIHIIREMKEWSRRSGRTRRRGCNRSQNGGLLNGRFKVGKKV